MPPTAVRRIFLSPKDTTGALQRNRPSFAEASRSSLFHLITPGKGKLYPVVYIEALAASTRGSIRTATVRQFNVSTVGTAKIEEAKKQFERRVAEQSGLSPIPEYLALSGVRTIFSINESMLASWRRTGAIETTTVEKRVFVNTATLLSTCLWSA